VHYLSFISIFCRLPRCRPDTAAVSLIFGSEKLPINPHIIVENRQLFNHVASHWNKPGAIRQIEAQKRTDVFIMAFLLTAYGDRWVSTRTSYVSTTRKITQSDFHPISVTPILNRVAEQSFVQKWLKPALHVEALNDQYAISKREALT
jgi:hypothetical protein